MTLLWPGESWPKCLHGTRSCYAFGWEDSFVEQARERESRYPVSPTSWKQPWVFLYLSPSDTSSVSSLHPCLNWPVWLKVQPLSFPHSEGSLLSCGNCPPSFIITFLVTHCPAPVKRCTPPAGAPRSLWALWLETRHDVFLHLEETDSFEKHSSFQGQTGRCRENIYQEKHLKDVHLYA